MNGSSRLTGGALVGLDHIQQSIHDILSTPKGSRVMRRGYGIDLLPLVDRPVNQDFVVEAAAAVGGALAAWEPRIEVERVGVTAGADGRVTATVGYHTLDGTPGSTEVPL